MVYYLQSRGDNINGEYTNGGKWSAGTPLATQKGRKKMLIKDFLKRKEELYWAKEQASKNYRENATTENWRAWNKAIDAYYSFIDGYEVSKE